MELPQTLIDAVRYFSNRERCENLLRDIRWPDGLVKCPHCKSTHVRYMNSVNRWKCYTKHKRPQFSVRTGTIFDESAVPLSKWFVCLYLIVSAKNGIASWEVHRAIGVTQKTAWFMLQRIRAGLKTRKRRLEGVVEVRNGKESAAIFAPFVVEPEDEAVVDIEPKEPENDLYREETN